MAATAHACDALILALTLSSIQHALFMGFDAHVFKAEALRPPAATETLHVGALGIPSY